MVGVQQHDLAQSLLMSNPLQGLFPCVRLSESLINKGDENWPRNIENN